MGTRKPSHLNFVHNDEIWKDHVRHELHSLRQWPKKWGYLTKEYDALNKQLIGETTTPDSTRRSRRIASATVLSRKSSAAKADDHLPDIATTSSMEPRNLGSSTKSPQVIGTRKTSVRGRRMGSYDFPRLPAIRSDSNPTSATPRSRSITTEISSFMGGVAPVPPKFPHSTAGEVGWKSAVKENQLEVYGRYAPNARGQHGILNLLKWPQQGL